MSERLLEGFQQSTGFADGMACIYKITFKKKLAHTGMATTDL